MFWYRDKATGAVDPNEFAADENVFPKAAGAGVDDGTAPTGANFRAGLELPGPPDTTAWLPLAAAHYHRCERRLHVRTTVI